MMMMMMFYVSSDGTLNFNSLTSVQLVSLIIFSAVRLLLLWSPRHSCSITILHWHWLIIDVSLSLNYRVFFSARRIAY